MVSGNRSWITTSPKGLGSIRKCVLEYPATDYLSAGVVVQVNLGRDDLGTDEEAEEVVALNT